MHKTGAAGARNTNTMTNTERVAKLRKARLAAVKVRDEIQRQDDNDLTSTGPERRAPVLQRAKNQVRLIDIEIGNILASADEIKVDELQVDRLQVLAERLDRAIVANALIDLAMNSLTAVLNAVSEVRETLT